LNWALNKAKKRRPVPAAVLSSSSEFVLLALCLSHIRGLEAFRTFGDIEGHVVAFFKRLETLTLDFRVVDEDIVTV
jgi:hypothetical protein